MGTRRDEIFEFLTIDDILQENMDLREKLSACEEEKADIQEDLEDYETRITKIGVKTGTSAQAGCNYCDISITIKGADGSYCNTGSLGNDDNNWENSHWDYFDCDSSIDQDHHVSGCCNFHAGFDRSVEVNLHHKGSGGWECDKVEIEFGNGKQVTCDVNKSLDNDQWS